MSTHTFTASTSCDDFDSDYFYVEEDDVSLDILFQKQTVVKITKMAEPIREVDPKPRKCVEVVDTERKSLRRVKMNPAKNWKGVVFTFAGAVEHHVGMEVKGSKRPPLTTSDLIHISKTFSTTKKKLINLGVEGADILVVKRGLPAYVDADQMLFDVKALGLGGVDTMCRQRGKTVNKLARYNFNVTDEAEEADYAKGVGTTYTFSSFPHVQKIREWLGTKLPNNRLLNLNAEANVYHSNNSGIGFHGDTERGIVIGVNLGEERTIEWQKFQSFLPVGDRTSVKLNHGDCYFMTGKAAGIDWRKSSIVTVRHRAGYNIWLYADEKRNRKKWKYRRAKYQLRETGNVHFGYHLQPGK